jgi:hypothetical protein
MLQALLDDGVPEVRIISRDEEKQDALRTALRSPNVSYYIGDGGWPHMFRPNLDGTPSRHATPDRIRTTSYYDTVNFARRVKVPGFYIWGYNDETCPPTSTHAAFNVITAPKTLALELEQQHSYPEEQNLAIYAWVDEVLGLK